MTTTPPVQQNARRAAKPSPLGDGQTALKNMAHNRLDELFEQAESDKIYGTVGVEVNFEQGRATTVRRVLNGTDKATH